MIRARYSLHIAAANADATQTNTRSIDVIASTQSTDSHGRVVVQDWDLARFEKNPVVLWDHGMAGAGMFGGSPLDATLPIGFASKVRVEGSQLLATINFVDEKANPLAEKVFQGVKQGSIRGLSVGWVPSEVTETEAGDLVLTGNELLEISVVAIPANAEAVALNEQQFASLRETAKPTTKGNEMKQIAKALGLTEAATETEVASAVSALVEAKKDSAVEIAALKSRASRADALETELAAVKAESTKTRLASIVEKGKAEGKITPANLAGFYEACGGDAEGVGVDVARFEKLVDVLAPVAVNRAPHETPAGRSVSALDPEVAALAKKMGITPEEIRATAESTGFTSGQE